MCRLFEQERKGSSRTELLIYISLLGIISSLACKLAEGDLVGESYLAH